MKLQNTGRLQTPTKEELQKEFYTAQLLAPIDTDDVKTFINQLKKRKAPG